MYTQKNFNDDLFKICQSKYVKFRLLQDFAYGKITKRDFAKQLLLQKDIEEIKLILKEIYTIQEKIKQNGGKLDEDPIKASIKLKKEGKLDEAFNIIFPYIQNKNDAAANLTFAWIMYDYLKTSESNVVVYADHLKKLNDNIRFDFSQNNNEDITKLSNAILWSIKRVVIQGELPANTIFEQFKVFVGNSPAFIEKRTRKFSENNNEKSISRLLIKEIRSKLNDRNYFCLMDMIGFDWFDDLDYEISSFLGKNNEMVKTKPFAESILNYHAKKLIKSDAKVATKERMLEFLPKLTKAINYHVDYEWLPYYRIKLLINLGDKEQAFSEATKFAINKKDFFWIWDLIGELVDGEEKFNCLCAGLLCKTKPDMIIGIQEKILPYLIERKLYAEAKYILDKLIETRTNKGWIISSELQSMKNSIWYVDIESAQNIDELKPFAEEAKKILYSTLPLTDAYITYINDEKGIINFAFIERNNTRRGYFYKDNIDNDFIWEINTPIKIQMIADKKSNELFHIFSVEIGDTEFTNNFVKEFSGTFEQVKEFGFIRDSIAEIFVNPILVKENKLQPFSKVYGTIIKKWDSSKNRWNWKIASIDKVEESSISDFEKEFYDSMEITSSGFGFVDECFVPKDLITNIIIDEFEYVRVKAKKSWDKSKGCWSWKATEIISTESEEEFNEWVSESGEIFELQYEAECLEYLKWVENSLNVSVKP